MKSNFLKALVAVVLAFGMCACGNKKNDEAASLMKYRELGSTGIQVSEIGIGCGAFAHMDTAQARVYMDLAIDSGINYIDIYDANPVVRGNIGYALEGRRDKMVIQGHLGSYWDGEHYARTRDVELAKKGFNDLLTLLKTDHIEVGMIHIADNLQEWDSIINSPFMDYVNQLKAEGKVQHIGMSSHNAEVALAAAKSGLVEVIMFSLNPAFDRVDAQKSVWDTSSYSTMLPGIDPVRVELYNYCAQHHIAITVMKAFGGRDGWLLKEGSPLGAALTPVQCLAYALANPAVAVAITGADNVEQLQESLNYLTATDEEKDYSSVLNTNSQSGQPAECTYCGHCSPCPVGIDIAQVNRLLDKAAGQSKVPADVMAEYKALEHHASECTGCGGCENRCPFDVPVREKMKQAVEVFGM